jgi:2-polyprenyl-3-methyl-5-hydroxy-6-metoxy-1,4-benzoquinol methylase
MQKGYSMSNYDNNKDYYYPYHWTINENDFFYSGVMYFGYLRIISDKISKLGCNGKNHLDIGCGDGRATSFLCKKNNLVSKGIDISSRAIAFAKLMDDSGDITFSSEDLFTIDVKYDIVTAVEVLEHIDINTLSKFTSKICQLINNNGYFICSVPSINLPTSLHRGHVQHFDSESIASLLIDSGFRNLEMFYQHNMNFSFFFTKNILIRILYSMIKNRYFTINAFEGILSRQYYKKWNVCQSEHNAARIICVAQK